jgi:hypothetical protein
MAGPARMPGCRTQGACPASSVVDPNPRNNPNVLAVSESESEKKVQIRLRTRNRIQTLL